MRSKIYTNKNFRGNLEFPWGISPGYVWKKHWCQYSPANTEKLGSWYLTVLVHTQTQGSRAGHRTDYAKPGTPARSVQDFSQGARP